MTCPSYAVKRGDVLPILEVLLLDGTGDPADLTNVEDLIIRVRNAKTLEPIWQQEAAIVDLANQETTDPDRGRVRVTWEDDATVALGVGAVEAEFKGTIGGKPITWPSEGYAAFSVWLEIGVPESGS